MSTSWWGLMRTFSNHQCDHKKPVRLIPFSKPDLPVARLRDYWEVRVYFILSKVLPCLESLRTRKGFRIIKVQLMHFFPYFSVKKIVIWMFCSTDCLFFCVYNYLEERRFKKETGKNKVDGWIAQLSKIRF